MKKVYIYLAEGFEEIEALAPADILRRAGAQVTLISISEHTTVTGAHGIRVTADCTINSVQDDADMIVLPGGCPGYENLAKCSSLEKTIEKMLSSKKTVAAICGAPAAVLGEKGFLKGRRAVCYPGMENRLFCKETPDAGVCVDGNIITAKSAGYAVDFALTLVEHLFGSSQKVEVENGIVYHG